MDIAEILYGTPLDEEPWVVLPNKNDLESWGERELVRSNQRFRQGQKYLSFQNAFDLIYANKVDGDYLEFGCHRARTFRMALSEARRRNLNNMRFLAFDSFEGLPPSDGTHGVSTYEPRSLATSEEDFLSMISEHGIYVDRVDTFKGYYHALLTEDLSAKLQKKGTEAAMITIDCDLYESAVPVFNFTTPFLQEGTYLYIDDYFVGYRGNPRKGVPRAFHEFEASSEFGFHPHTTVGWWGKTFIVFRK